MTDVIVTPKQFYEFTKDFRFLRTGFKEGLWMGNHIICPNWTEIDALFRMEEAIKKMGELLN